MHKKNLFLPILKNGKYGFINEKGKTVINPRFKNVSSRFSDGYSKIVYIKKLSSSIRWVFGYIDKTGEIKIFLHWEDVGDFSEELSYIKINGKYGYIDTSLEEVINPKFELACDFNEGLASVRYEKKWGYINKKGDFAINPTYSYVSSFKEGIALVEHKKNH